MNKSNFWIVKGKLKKTKNGSMKLNGAQWPWCSMAMRHIPLRESCLALQESGSALQESRSARVSHKGSSHIRCKTIWKKIPGWGPYLWSDRAGKTFTVLLEKRTDRFGFTPSQKFKTLRSYDKMLPWVRTSWPRAKYFPVPFPDLPHSLHVIATVTIKLWCSGPKTVSVST